MAAVAGSQAERLLQETLATGRVGALTVDPQYLVFEPQMLTADLPNDDSNDVLLSATKLYIVIGCIVALVLVAIIQAGCTIYRTAKSPSPHHKEHLIPSSAWRDYSAANTNYAFEAFESEEKPPQPGGPGASSNGSSRSNGGRDVVDGAGGVGRPRGHGPPSYGHGDSRSLQRHSQGPAPRGHHAGHHQYPPERSTYSLPRTAHGPPVPHNGYYTQDRRSHSGAHGGANAQGAARELQPDFYFMPSQRKYSGEVVRVYVDYNTTPRK